MNITLKPIDENNFLDAFHLQLRDDQTQYVSHPIRSLAQAYVYRNQCQPFGIYADARMVGYVMVIYDYDVPEYDIWHMMIDAAEQGKGYGTAAMKAVLDYIATKPFGDSGRVVLTCHQANIPAMRLYESLGFQHTGNVDEDGEEEMVKGVQHRHSPSEILRIQAQQQIRISTPDESVLHNLCLQLPYHNHLRQIQ